MSGYGFIRVSTGSQDASSQERDIRAHCDDNGITLLDVITTDTRSASASAGEQVDAIDGLIDRLSAGDLIIVTDSSRLDRREDLDAQMLVLIRIRQAGGDVLSVTEPQFGKTDTMSRAWTVMMQGANAEKSRTVKNQTWRGVQSIIANRGHYGPLPMLWATRGERYGKEAYCTDVATVTAIYEAVADGESLQSVGRRYDVWPQQIKTLIRFEANHTGAIRCSYTYSGETFEWSHTVAPVVESPLWWRANKVLTGNTTASRANKGGRPVASPANWLSGLYDCPECGGRLFVNAGHTPAGNPRTPKLRCGGFAKTRKACGRFKGMDVAPEVAKLESRFGSDDTELLAYQRVAGNAHELEEMRAESARLQARLSATDDDDELDALVARRKALRAEISAFKVVPDSFDYAPVSDGPRTVAELWVSSDDAKRTIVKAAKRLYVLVVGSPIGELISDDEGIVDLGDGICFNA
jgi:hypothetical protein